LEISNPQYGVSFARSDAILDPLKYALSSSNGSKLIKGLVSHWFGWKLLQRPFSLKASSALPMHRKKGKVFPYSLPSVGPGADPGVQAVSPQVT